MSAFGFSKNLAITVIIILVTDLTVVSATGLHRGNVMLIPADVLSYYTDELYGAKTCCNALSKVRKKMTVSEYMIVNNV